ncbi:MAG: transposase [Candidatus Electronema sp. VV]
MIFTSSVYAIFLALVVTAYWALRRRQAQNLFLLAASYVFYGWVTPWFGGGLNPLFFSIYCSVIMKQHIEISCRHCGADDFVRNGRSENGTNRYRCNKCGKSFHHEYT